MRAGFITLGLTALFAAAAPLIAPNDPATPFADRTYASPTHIHVSDASGWHAPFIYRQRLVDRVMHRYADDTSARVPIVWMRGGRLMTVAADEGPLLFLGGDKLGRDVFSELAFGARLSLGVTLIGACGALLIGGMLGAFAGVAGGLIETSLMWLADFMIVLPAIYLLLVVRSMMTIAPDVTTVFTLMAILFAAAAWPGVARGVRGIVATERARDYAQAARAIGAGPIRLVRHVLPAARGFLAVELVLLVPAMLVAEVTLSYLGLGFPSDARSWGTMLQDLNNVALIPEAPWLLAPAVMLFVVVLGLQMVLGPRAERTTLTAASRS